MTWIGFDPLSFAASALVHMYSKCATIQNAKRVFKGMPRLDLVSWTSLIVGMLKMINRIRLCSLSYFSNQVPSMTTLLLLGFFLLVSMLDQFDKVLEYFHLIKEKGGLTHITDHYACTAENIINQMPMKPHQILWASLLGGCKILGNFELVKLKHAAEALFLIESENLASYMPWLLLICGVRWQRLERLLMTQGW